MKIVDIVTPFLSTEIPSVESLHEAAEVPSITGSTVATGGAGPLESIQAKLGEANGIKIIQQLYGIDMTAGLALATAAVFEVSAVMAKLRGKEDIPQTEAYWMVDVWGRAEALKALIFDFCHLIDAEQLTGFTANGFCSRAGVLTLGCDELLVLVCQHLAHDLPQPLVKLALAVKSSKAAAKSAIEAHITDL